jgi:hypothetical protein
MTIEKASRNTPDQMDLPFVCLAILGRQPAHPGAHFDLINERGGIRWGQRSPMRWTSEMPHDTGRQADDPVAP